jgi:hypothetical protein
MKTLKILILSSLAASSATLITSCTTVVETPAKPNPQVTTTTTERSSLHHPGIGTTETKTTRTY